MDNQNDKSTIGMRLVCILIPLVGIILYITKHKESPKSSKDYLMCTIAGIVFWFVVFNLF